MSAERFFQYLYFAWLITEIVTVLATYTRRTGGKISDRGSLRLLWVVIFSSVFCGIWYGASHPWTIFGGAAWVFWLGLAMMIAGLLIRWTAILTLGRSFSVNVAIHAEQKVKRGGIFRFVRHPSYTGLLLILAAMGVHTRNWIALAILTLPPLAALLYRIRVEEEALNESFGADYADYARRTKRLIPFVY